MTPEEELDAALLSYDQAEERVGLENRNWHYFQMSRDSLIRSMQEMGLSHDKAVEQFNASMQARSESYSNSLEQRAIASSQLADVLRRFPQLVRDPRQRNRRSPGI